MDVKTELKQLMELRGQEFVKEFGEKHGGIMGLCQKVKTSPGTGIEGSDQDVASRKEMYGSNIIPKQDKRFPDDKISQNRYKVTQQGQVIESGDVIPVDGIWVSGEDIKRDESMLTGETELVSCSTNPEILAGASVADGSGVMVTLCVGSSRQAYM